MELNNKDIDNIYKLLSTTTNKNGKPYMKEDEENAFKNFMYYVMRYVLENESAEIEQLKSIGFPTKTREQTDIRREAEEMGLLDIKGEFEFLLRQIKFFLEKGNAKATNGALDSLLGTFWEREFCSMVSELKDDKYYMHRFQKYKPFGAARMGWGIKRIEEWKMLPDVLIGGRGWVGLADIKHKEPTKQWHGVGEGYIGMEGDHHDDLRWFSRLSPNIPIIYVIHDYSLSTFSFGKWGFERSWEHWRAQDLLCLGEPDKERESLGYGASRLGGKYARTTCYWHKDHFCPLKDVLRECKERNAPQGNDDAP